MERKEIIEMIEEKLATKEAYNEGLFKVIDNKLDSIKEQTTKTNGRVTSLELSVRNDISELDKHKLSCPLRNEVRIIQDKQLSNETIKTFLVKLGVVIVGSITGIITLLQLFLF